jgi:hypothetical protein
MAWKKAFEHDGKEKERALSLPLATRLFALLFYCCGAFLAAVFGGVLSLHTLRTGWMMDGGAATIWVLGSSVHQGLLLCIRPLHPVLSPRTRVDFGAHEPSPTFLNSFHDS